jgi:signal transduction histidine kinase
MAVDLSAVAAGMPMAASFAMAGGFVAFREARRRSALNAALHELRRPLQALSLLVSAPASAGGPVAGSLEMAVAAVDRLDCEINGRPGLNETERFFVRPIVEATVERWRPIAARSGRSLDLTWSGGDGELEGSRIALAQVVDNMISNALEHGSGAIALEAEVELGVCRLSVRDEGGAAVSGVGRVPSPGRFSGRRRHGHGLRIVRRVAARHRGRFSLVRAGGGTEARLALPVGEGRR